MDGSQNNEQPQELTPARVSRPGVPNFSRPLSPRRVSPPPQQEQQQQPSPREHSGVPEDNDPQQQFPPPLVYRSGVPNFSRLFLQHQPLPQESQQQPPSLDHLGVPEGNRPSQRFPPPLVHHSGVPNFSRPFLEPPPQEQQQPSLSQNQEKGKFDWLPGKKSKKSKKMGANDEKMAKEEEEQELERQAWEIRKYLANLGLNPNYKYNYLADKKPEEKKEERKEKDENEASDTNSVTTALLSGPLTMPPFIQPEGEMVTPWPELYPQADILASLNKTICPDGKFQSPAHQEVLTLLSDTWLAMTGQKQPTVSIAKILDEVLNVKLAVETPQPNRETSMLSSFANAPIMGAAPVDFMTRPQNMTPVIGSPEASRMADSPTPGTNRLATMSEEQSFSNDDPIPGSSRQGTHSTQRTFTDPSAISTPHIAVIEKWNAVVHKLIYCRPGGQNPHISSLHQLADLALKIAKAVLKHSGYDLSENKETQKAEREFMEAQVARIQWGFVSSEKGDADADEGQDQDNSTTKQDEEPEDEKEDISSEDESKPRSSRSFRNSLSGLARTYSIRKESSTADEPTTRPSTPARSGTPTNKKKTIKEEFTVRPSTPARAGTPISRKKTGVDEPIARSSTPTRAQSPTISSILRNKTSIDGPTTRPSTPARAGTPIVSSSLRNETSGDSPSARSSTPARLHTPTVSSSLKKKTSGDGPSTRPSTPARSGTPVFRKKTIGDSDKVPSRPSTPARSGIPIFSKKTISDSDRPSTPARSGTPTFGNKKKTIADSDEPTPRPSTSGARPAHIPTLKKSITSNTADTTTATSTADTPAAAPPVPTTIERNPRFDAGLRAAYAAKFLSFAEAWVEYAKWLEDEDGESPTGGFSRTATTSPMTGKLAAEKRAMAVAQLLGWQRSAASHGNGSGTDDLAQEVRANPGFIDTEAILKREVVWATAAEVDDRMRAMGREDAVWRRCERQMLGRALARAAATPGLDLGPQRMRYAHLWREEFGREEVAEDEESVGGEWDEPTRGESGA